MLGLSVLGVQLLCISILVCGCVLIEVASSTCANVSFQLSIRLHNTELAVSCGTELVQRCYMGRLHSFCYMLLLSRN